ncbi:MAG: DNA photolyase [Proteobacteria bacterium]|nr:DNA photolyase [Pseudomonadota bacterium]
MFSAIYIEEEVANTARVESILQKFPDIPQIRCERYGEIFNRKAQNFRLQKRAPALILAKKYGKLVLPAPAGYGFDASASYYFSHMLNCVYDCRYCFLQGMYRSANYVLFTNYEDFGAAIDDVIEQSAGSSVFYSGYDCDSLALDPVSNFCRFFVPEFSRHPQATLEVRTKSTQVRHLLEMQPIPNCVIAMSFTPEEAAARWEHKVPAIGKRIEALGKLQKAGWKVALRFEPIIFGSEIFEAGAEASDTLAAYRQLFIDVFEKIDPSTVHSVSTGLFRMPVSYYKNIVKLYPDEALFARQTETRQGLVLFSIDRESEQLEALEKLLFGFINRQQYYRCA